MCYFFIHVQTLTSHTVFSPSLVSYSTTRLNIHSLLFFLYFTGCNIDIQSPYYWHICNITSRATVRSRDSGGKGKTMRNAQRTKTEHRKRVKCKCISVFSSPQLRTERSFIFNYEFGPSLILSNYLGNVFKRTNVTKYIFVHLFLVFVLFSKFH